jgi:hypothetical protein
MATPIKYDTKVIHITLSGYHREKIQAIADAIADGDQKNATVETKALKAGRVEIPHIYVMTEAANGNVEEFEIHGMFDNDPLRVARVMGALLGASDIITRMDMNSGKTFRW